MAWTTALVALIVLSEQLLEIVGLPYPETKSQEELLIRRAERSPDEPRRGICRKVQRRVRWEVRRRVRHGFSGESGLRRPWREQQVLVVGLTDARAGLRLIL